MKNDVMVYTPPEVGILYISIEAGFSLSTGIKDWEEGSNESGEAE